MQLKNHTNILYLVVNRYIYVFLAILVKVLNYFLKISTDFVKYLKLPKNVFNVILLYRYRTSSTLVFV